ncbi:hypothetical protein O181_011694 [Austropuccinia psidii MF-1]|uniref:Integrase catalytic domain-containing protein n=1 Tax=Austropuccinia psidii MF-1 TaxID=1389203 RepID=A0A9Q3BUY5_9BASI|nr:hypothetical protein [Austropuccinia psidii MF-1]
MIKLQEHSRLWETVHMDCVTGLPPPGSNRNYNDCIVSFDSFSKTKIALPFHKDDKSMDKALLMRNRVASWTGIFTNITSESDPKFTSELWKNPHQLLGTKLSFSTTDNPKTDDLAEKMIQTLYDITSAHASTIQTPSILDKGWNPRLPQDPLRNDFSGQQPTAARFKEMLEKASKDAVRFVEDTFAYAKDKWDRSRPTPDFKLGDLVILSATKLNNIKVCKNLKDSFSDLFSQNTGLGKCCLSINI